MGRVFITRLVPVTGDTDEKCHVRYETCAASIGISGNGIEKKTFPIDAAQNSRVDQCKNVHVSCKSQSKSMQINAFGDAA